MIHIWSKGLVTDTLLFLWTSNDAVDIGSVQRHEGGIPVKDSIGIVLKSFIYKRARKDAVVILMGSSKWRRQVSWISCRSMSQTAPAVPLQKMMDSELLGLAIMGHVSGRQFTRVVSSHKYIL